MTNHTDTTTPPPSSAAIGPDPSTVDAGEGSAPTGDPTAGGSGSFRTASGIWVEARGAQGHPVLLVAGLGDPAEAWALQLDHLAATHRVAAFDNRGVGRSDLPATTPTTSSMGDDALEVMDALGWTTAHVIGFSGGSAIAQELALGHPTRVDTLTLVGTWARADASFRARCDAWRWMAEAAPSERAFFEAFFVWVYSARAHATGFVDDAVEDALAFPHQQSLEAFHQQLDAFLAHDTQDRLSAIDVPTLVVAGGRDLICPPELGRVVAGAIPGARFELLPDEAHQPFQESPEQFHRLIHGFWSATSSDPDSMRSDRSSAWPGRPTPSWP